MRTAWLLLLLAVAVLLGSGALLWTVTKNSPQEKAEKNATTILVIYNHGSSGDQTGDCRRSRRPSWVKNLATHTIDGMTIKIEHPCTNKEEEGFTKVDGWCGLPRVCNRARKIVEEIEIYVKRGYKREHIFLAGQSAGAWASLLIKRAEPNRFNAVIGTAPAFHGQRQERFCEKEDCSADDDEAARMKGRMRYLHNKAFGKGAENKPDLAAFIFPMHCDVFGWPSEYPFDGNASVKFSPFPPSIDYPKDRSAAERCEYGKRMYFYNGMNKGELVYACAKVEDPERSKPKKSQLCSLKRIAHCPPEMRKLCGNKSHGGLPRSKGFEAWLMKDVQLLGLIKGRLSWRPSSDKPNDAPPCAFIDRDKICNNGKYCNCRP